MNIFTSDECVVCLDAAPATIFCPCGHQCCCSECSARIQAAAAECPLCRQVIAEHRAFVLDEDVVAPEEPEVIESFSVARRAEYVARIRPHHTSNAAFVGKSKFARSVSRAIGNELEERQKETRGGERVMTPQKKITYERVGDTLTITYKVGRKAHNESCPYMEWADAVAEMAGEKTTVLDLAVHNPDYYWLCAYHHAGKVETALRDAGLLEQNKKGRF